jgi:hypothetical protein
MPEVIFDQINVKAGTARIISNNGAGSLTAILGDDSVHLLEITGSGNMNITTIYNPVNPKLNRNYPVVHSRHVQTGAGPYPSQYIGTCERLQ